MLLELQAFDLERKLNLGTSMAALIHRATGFGSKKMKGGREENYEEDEGRFGA